MKKTMKTIVLMTSGLILGFLLAGCSEGAEPVQNKVDSAKIEKVFKSENAEKSKKKGASYSSFPLAYYDIESKVTSESNPYFVIGYLDGKEEKSITIEYRDSVNLYEHILTDPNAEAKMLVKEKDDSYSVHVYRQPYARYIEGTVSGEVTDKTTQEGTKE
ncbi:hypothetical protein ACFC9N_11055 [Enterococcus casseliflavus]|uniref:hypothetical protein n=1 Tax=Enterococcus casseliflavus TaxID=37734 RepID=UPI0039A44C60